MKIAVIGAGISGMASALKLAEAGHDVSVIAAAFSPHTTSNRAAAFWLPYHIRSDKRGIEWCRKSYQAYKQLAGDPNTGISMKTLVKLVADDVAQPDRSWKAFMPPGSFRTIRSEDLPEGYSEGEQAEVPLIETQLFLPWLQVRLEQYGVAFHQKTIESLEGLTGYDRVVNCTGLGARALCNDPLLVSFRGQVALLSPGPDLPIFLDNEKPRYIVPRKDAIIIGGTYEENRWEECTEPDTIAFLLQKAYDVYPELKQQQYLGSWAGLRPCRPEVRLERTAGSHIIHNYGHGGSGFTLAFGCAEDVLKLVNES